MNKKERALQKRRIRRLIHKQGLWLAGGGVLPKVEAYRCIICHKLFLRKSAESGKHTNDSLKIRKRYSRCCSTECALINKRWHHHKESYRLIKERRSAA